jgi:hypothetical protein
MPEEISNLPKNYTPQDSNGSSKLFGVSVKDWCVLLIVISVCSIDASNYVFTCLGYTSANYKTEEPLYSGFMLVLGYMFGKKDSAGNTAH